MRSWRRSPCGWKGLDRDNRLSAGQLAHDRSLTRIGILVGTAHNHERGLLWGRGVRPLAAAAAKPFPRVTCLTVTAPTEERTRDTHLPSGRRAQPRIALSADHQPSALGYRDNAWAEGAHTWVRQPPEEATTPAHRLRSS